MNERKKPKPGPSVDKPALPVVCPAGTFKERYAAGKAMREACPRNAHAIWKPSKDRRHLACADRTVEGVGL